MGGYGNRGKFPDPSVLAFSVRRRAFAIRLQTLSGNWFRPELAVHCIGERLETLGQAGFRGNLAIPKTENTYQNP